METKFFEKVSDRLKSEHLQGEQSRVEDKVYKLMEQAGILDDISKLSEERQDSVVDGIVALWNIDVIGKTVETRDREKIQGSIKSPESANEAVRKQVESELREIDSSYHGVNNEWLPESVKQLVNTALETNPKNMYLNREGIMWNPDHYIEKLKSAGDYYKNVISGVYPPEERVDMDSYITGERRESIDEMRTIFNTKLSDVVVSLQPLPQEDKK